MTRTYSDMDAAMQLLEKQERDLELATEIGQMLISKNKEVSHKKDLLEKKVSLALEQILQLRHEISKKEQLLCFYADAEIDSPDNVLNIKHVKEENYMSEKVLCGKVRQLKKEKSVLMEENSLLVAHTEEIRSKRHALVSHAQVHLTNLQDDLQSANSQMQTVTNELSECKHVTCTQSHEILSLLYQIAELQKKHSQLLTEHEYMQHQLVAVNRSHDGLSQDLQNLKYKYHEALMVLEETRDEMYMLPRTNVNSGSIQHVHDISLDCKVLPVNCFGSYLRATCSSCTNQNASSFVLSIPRPLVKLFVQYEQRCRSKPLEKNSVDEISNATGRDFQMHGQLCSTPLWSSSLALKKRRQGTQCQYNQTTKRFYQPLFQEVQKQSSLKMGQPGVPGTIDLDHAIDDLACAGNEKLRAVEQAKMFLATKQRLKRNDSLKSCISLTSPKLRLVKPLEGSGMLQKWKTLAECTFRSPTPLNNSMKLGMLHRHSFTINQSVDRSLCNMSECTWFQNASQNLCVSEMHSSSPVQSSTSALELRTQFPKLSHRTCASFDLMEMTSHSKNIASFHSTANVSAIELTQLHGSIENHNL